MNECRKHNRRFTTGLTVTWCFIISYLVISSSPDFAPYAPIPASPVVLYVVITLAGLITGFVVEDLREGILRVALFVLIPPLVGGTARTVLPVLILGGGFQMGIFVGSWVLQRVLVQVLVLALFGVASYLLGLFAYEASH